MLALSNFRRVRGLFEILKMFHPPMPELEWGPIYILSILLGLEKGVGTFKFTKGERPFLNLENV